MNWYEVVLKNEVRVKIPAAGGYKLDGAVLTFLDEEGLPVRSIARGKWIQVRKLEGE